MKKLRTIYIILIVIICISVMFVNAREPLNDDINVDVTVKSKVPIYEISYQDSHVHKGCYTDWNWNLLRPSNNKETPPDGEGAYSNTHWNFDAASSTPLTKEKCAETCADAEYSFFGLKKGFMCYCSDMFDRVKSRQNCVKNRKKWRSKNRCKKVAYQASDKCTTPCVGDPSQTCGGEESTYGVIDVYEIGSSTTTTTSFNANADTTQLNTLSLYEKNEDNMYSDISSLNFTNKNVDESNNYENDDSFTLSLNDLNNNGVQNISRANIDIGDDDLDIDNAYIDISSNNGTCITSGNYTISSIYMPANSSTNIDFGTPLSINDSCNANAPGAQSLNIS